MPRRLKLIVAYDGAPFSGWQSQKHGNTVQDRLEHAFHRISGEPVRVHGAGRTDAGVHALAQCAHVDLADGKLTPRDWMRALNAMLPPQIRVLRCGFVRPEFDARRSAKAKVYRYRVWNDAVLPPLEYGRAWHIPQRLDTARMARAAQLFVGNHDFRAFAANRGRPELTTRRTIYSARTRRRGRCVELEFEGDGFLYKMVRLLVGSIVQCAAGAQTLTDLAAQLNLRSTSKRRIVAPATGLFLVRVRY